MKRLEARIVGRVQMVMFRDFVRRKANKLGLAGMVKNEQDGSVFVVAEGREDALKMLAAYLRTGPMLARVDSADVRWLDAQGNFDGFRIVY